MAYADRGRVPGAPQRFLPDDALVGLLRTLADEQEALSNRILCHQIDPDEHYLSSRDTCREENIAAVQYTEVVNALTGTVFRKDPPRTARTKAALLRTRYVDAHSENASGRLRWFTRNTAFLSRQRRCVTAAFTASNAATHDGATESSFPSCASVIAGGKTSTMIHLTMMVTRRYARAATSLPRARRTDQAVRPPATRSRSSTRRRGCRRSSSPSATAKFKTRSSRTASPSLSISRRTAMPTSRPRSTTRSPSLQLSCTLSERTRRCCSSRSASTSAAHAPPM